MMKLSFSRNCSAVDVHEDWPGEGWQTLVERDVRGPRDCAVSQPRGRSELCGETFIKQCIKFSWLSLIFPWVSAEAGNTSQSPLLFKTGHIKTFLLCPSFRILLLYQSPQKRENEIQGVSTHDASEAEIERYWLFLLIKKTRLEWGHKRRETENKDFVPIFNLSLPYLTSQDESTA